MKVLHIIDSGGLYGAEIMLLNLVQEQIKMGLEPTICSIGEKGIIEKPIESEAIKRGIKVEKFRMAPGPNFLGAFKILRYAKKERFDILHSHGYKGNILLGFIPRSLREIPLITTVHGWTSIATRRFSRMKLYEWLDVRSLRRVDRVVLVNKAMLSNPRLKAAKLNNLTVINNGIPPIADTKLSNDLDKKVVDFCKDSFVVGAIGRLSYEKGFNFLIEAIAKLSGEIPNIKLVIIGEGGERGILEKMVSDLGLQEKVMMPGYRETAHKYIPLFNLFVISSLTEGLPITLLEAMQYGVPIVATEVGGIPEVLDKGKAGILIGSCRSDQLRDAVKRVYNDPASIRTMTEKAKDRVQKSFSSHNMASAYYDLYKAAAGVK